MFFSKWKKLDRNRVYSAFMAVVLLSFLAGCSSDSSYEPVTTVETSRDDKGVWFITGTEDASLYNIFEAQGYAVAADRLWQAETFRRTATGRLSEILGPESLQSDVFIRITGYSQTELQNVFASLNEDARTVINGYVAGFNRRIAEVRADSSLLPFEFKALNFSPEDWTVTDVLAWTSTMLRENDPEGTPKDKRGQIDNAALAGELMAKFGQEMGMAMFNDLRWVNDPQSQTYIPKAEILTAGTGKPGTKDRKENLFSDLRKVSEQMRERERMITQNLKKINADIRMGSYAWAVPGTRTESGNPILYSGPQMGFATPSYIQEGSVRAGGINMSGMFIPGIPGMIIGRTPHHAWSMQVGHAHTSDYYFENPADVVLDRMETIKVAGSADVTVPVFKTVHGPVINPMPYNPETYAASADNPIIAWKYANRTYEFRNIEALLDMARAESMDDFGRAIDKVATSMHLCYADKDGNIAYWMSGRDPVRPAGEYRFPQGFLPGVPVAEWDAAVVRPCSTDRNTSKGYYTGWNNKSSADYDSSYNNLNYSYGIFHRGHLLDEYFSSHEKVSFEQLRDLAVNIVTTDTFGIDSNKNLHAGGNPWAFVSAAFSVAVQADSTMDRIMALAVMNNWDGHFVNGGASQWAGGTDRADAWMLSDVWIREVLRLTFADELGQETYEKQSPVLLFNVLLHGLAGASSSIVNNYNWFQNVADENAPQTSSAIIVTALDNTLAQLGTRPWGTGKREATVFKHDMLGQVHAMPFSNRSTYAHCVEMGPKGPVRIESMFPLGESGFIGMNADGTPAFDPHFFTMTEVFDTFAYREFPLFD